jgi:hypothetical protein
MKKTSIALSLMLAGIIMFVACKKNSLPADNSSGTCVTTGMKFSTDITPILSANCYSCHSGTTINGGINLSTYAGVKAVADNGKLVGSVSHAPGFKPMPDGGVKMNSCNIAKIQAWVTAGALNN